MLTYDKTRNIYIPGSSHAIPITRVNRNPDGSVSTSTTYLQRQNPAQHYSKSCKTRFSINGDGKIIAWDWEGNDCIAEAPD